MGGKKTSDLFKGGESVFINTDGRSVPWLHIRLDLSPKYYKSQILQENWGEERFDRAVDVKDQGKRYKEKTPQKEGFRRA